MKRTCTFKTVLYAVLRARGFNPATDLRPDLGHAIAEGVTQACEEAVKYRDWPEALELKPAVVETDPDSNLPYLPRQLSNGDVLHTVHGIWDKHPADATAKPIKYSLQPLGYYLPRIEADEVWIKYRPDPSTFSFLEFILADEYPAGTVVYDPVSGDCYKAIAYAHNKALSEPAYWIVQPVLEVLKPAVIAGATAHYLRTNAQDILAQNYETKMLGCLETEALLLLEAEQQNASYRRR